MKKKEISSPHDKLFRASMQYPEVARDFLEAHLPIDIKEKLDFKSIVTCQNTFIDEELKLTQSDVLLKLRIEDKEGYIYVLAEHQSKPDPLMPFRLLKYMVKIWDYHQSLSKQKNGLPFPAIFPMVFYAGQSAYNAPKAIWELCGDQANLMHRILNEPFCLVDVNVISENELTSRLWSGTMEFLMRHKFRQHLIHGIETIAHNINRLILEEKSQFVLQLLSYILAIDEEHRSTQELIALIQSKLAPQAGEEIVSLAEILKEEGRNEALRQVAKELLANGTDPVFVAKITKLPLDEIKKLQKLND
ncbi:MAG: Rpn family recombination-promoting nuclease/putative transposase [Gammaproteobacteria bacterium]|nr:Rpn family recombination-promoting nuclease/putative transposase [Gammaproteobacteria bacterium]